MAPSNELYKENWAVVEIDTEKIGNTDVLDLGFGYKPDILTTMICPRNENPHKFECPNDRLLQVNVDLGITMNDSRAGIKGRGAG